MPTNVFRDEVQRLLAQGAQLLDVMPKEDYEESHLPEAINLPLKKLERKTVGQLDRKRPVITYCHDFQ